MRGLPDHLLMTRLVHAGDRWFAFAGVDTTQAGGHDTTYVLTSTDGRTWKPGSTAGLGAGRISDVTVDHAGRLVVIGALDDASPARADKRPEYCGVVWWGDGRAPWQRGELGCNDSPPQVVATLTDGRILIAGNRDLWQHP